MFERRKIDLAQSSLIHDGIDAHAEMFLVVGAVVFERNADSRRLHAVHPGGAHAPGKERILREIFKVPAAQGRALDVDAGPQHRGHAERLGFGGNGFADGGDEIRIPGARGSDRGRETGGGMGLLHYVGAPAAFHLASEPVRAVRHAHGRDAVFFYWRRGPERESGTERGFFFKCEFFEDGDVLFVGGIRQNVFVFL